MGNCIANLMSHVVYFSEKFSIFLSVTALLSCIILCMVSMLAFGIGLGYNYSFVTYRSKQTFVAGHYKKVPPPYKYYPGYFKPGQREKALPTKKRTTTIPTTKTTTKPRLTEATTMRVTMTMDKVPDMYADYNEHPHLRGFNLQDQTVVTAPDVITQAHEQIGSPYGSPSELVKFEGQPRLPFTELKKEKQLEGLYFSEITTKFRVPLNPDSTQDTTTDVSNVIEKESNASNDINATKYRNESESVIVSVSKTHNDSALPHVIKTRMLPDQLWRWLARLRNENKTFAVHIAID